MASNVIFILLGFFVMRVLPDWIPEQMGFLKSILRWVCYLVGLAVIIYFVCSMLYNIPHSWYNLLY
ncbi:MAG: hypothetical protein IJ901_07625 [Bacteroidaceae bacterium]|nr:hypothetical protein [Bacteroidaceae bacterium]